MIMRVAAIQLQAGLGEVDLNLERAERLAGQAASEGAESIVLPEFFTTAMASTTDARRRRAAARRRAGRSFSRPRDGARRRCRGFLPGGDPDGWSATRSCSPAHGCGPPRQGPADDVGELLYEPGADDGVIEVTAGAGRRRRRWELIRSQTARRLRGRVQMVVGGSCWWDVAENLAGQALWRVVHRQNLELCRRTVPTLARLLGVPVVHANWCGEIDARWAMGTRYVSRYVQEACIVDASGRELARRGADEGPGVIAADLEIGEPPRRAERSRVPSGSIERTGNRTGALMWWLQNQHGRLYRRRTGAARVPASNRAPEVAVLRNGGEPEAAATVAGRDAD